jgi:hypothetical protein
MIHQTKNIKHSYETCPPLDIALMGAHQMTYTPALVSSRDDIEEYYVEDATPVNKDSPKGYAERFIHSELYKSYQDVNSVVHSHSEAVIPFSISSFPVRSN